MKEGTRQAKDPRELLQERGRISAPSLPDFLVGLRKTVLECTVMRKHLSETRNDLAN